MSSNIVVTNTCEYCKQPFNAKTVHTRYCSHTCNSRGYKQIKKEGKIEHIKRAFAATPTGKLQSAFDYAAILNKELLTIRETRAFLNITDVTLRRLLKEGVIQSSRLGKKHLIQNTTFI